MQFGIIYNPVTEELWTARRGAGAWYNGQKESVFCRSHHCKLGKDVQISVSDCTQLSRALVVQEYYDPSTTKMQMMLRVCFCAKILNM